MRTIAADDAKEENIWKITIKDAKEMLTMVWHEVTAVTIQNCWRHALRLDKEGSTRGTANSRACDFLFQLLTSEVNMRLPVADLHLAKILGSTLAHTAIWQKALATANDVEEDDAPGIKTACQLLTALRVAMCGLTGAASLADVATDSNMADVFAELQEQMDQLKLHNRIWDVPTINDFVEPPPEYNNKQELPSMPSNDDIITITSGREPAVVVASADATDSSNDESAAEEDAPSLSECIQLCSCVVAGFRALGVNSIALQQELFKAKGKLLCRQGDARVQQTLDSFLKPNMVCLDEMEVDGQAL